MEISIHALLAESDVQIIVVIMYALISIHALLAESDAVTSVARVATTVISIHALLAESDETGSLFFYGRRKFLSTLSLRRATRT